MDFVELIERRKSYRVFEQRSLEHDSLQAALETLNVAPSAGNLQAYHVYVITAPVIIKAIHAAAPRQYALETAQAVFVFCADTVRAAQKYGERGAQFFCVQDATIACTYVLLALANRGIGGVWIGSFDEPGVQQALGLAEGLLAVALLAAGYPAEPRERRPRRPLADVVTFMEA